MTATPDYYFNHGQKLVATDNNDGTKIPHVVTENITGKFREAFESYTPGTNWDEIKAAGDLVYVDGNAAAASYLVISKSPLTAGSETSITCQNQAEMPIELALGMSMSQRTLGQEFSSELVDTDQPLADVPDLAISSITQATTTLTVDTVLPHGLSVGKSIGIAGCSNPIANYPALVVATIPSPTQFTCLAGPGGAIVSQTITNPAGAKGYVFFRERLGRAQDGTSLIFEQPTATQASVYTRSEAGDAYPSGSVAGNHSLNVGTSASVQLVTASYTYAFASTTEYKLTQQADRLQWSDVAIDSLSGTSNRLTRTSVVPSPSKAYKLRFRAVNNDSLTVPNAQIISATKTGTTTATIVTDRAHGLSTTDVVVIYGIRDQAAASFPNLLAATAVASIVSPTSFTIVIGTASTVTSYGGYVARVNGGNLMSALGAVAQVVQSAVLSTLADGTRQLVLNGSASWAAPALIQGDVLELVGCRNAVDGTTLGIDGAWKIANVGAAVLTLVLPYAGSQTLPADFGSINCGGALIKRTELRISYARIFDYERERVELLTRPTTDVQGSVPVQITGGSVVIGSGTVTTVSTVTAVTTVSTVTAANLNFNQLIADVASAALTTTTTTAAFTPTFGISYQVNIPVTAVTGTNPTLDVTIEESDDGGTNWYKVYDFPRITATGNYRSPMIPLIGNRVRYVQTVGGTTPSFTRSVNRSQSSYPALMQRQLVDRSISLTTLNSVTPTIIARDAGNATQLIINVGAITTTAPALQLEGSDDFGVTWYAIGSPLTAVASSTVQVTVPSINAAALRARVSTAGVGVTAGYVMIKAQD